MIKKYSLLTILTVIILVGSSAEHLLAQKVVKMPPSIKGQKTAKRGIITNVKNPPKPPKNKPPTTPTPPREPEQSSRWELTGEIKVYGEEPYNNGICTKKIIRGYKAKVILDYKQEGFPVVTDPNELAKISVNLPKSITDKIGKSSTMWTTNPLKPRAEINGDGYVGIFDELKCSYKDNAFKGSRGDIKQTWTFSDNVPLPNYATVTLDKGQKTIEFGLDFAKAAAVELKTETTGTTSAILVTTGLPPYPLIAGVTVGIIKIPARAAFLEDPNTGFTTTFEVEANEVIAQKKYPKVVVTYTFKKL